MNLENTIKKFEVIFNSPNPEQSNIWAINSATHHINYFAELLIKQQGYNLIKVDVYDITIEKKIDGERARSNEIMRLLHNQIDEYVKEIENPFLLITNFQDLYIDAQEKYVKELKTQHKINDKFLPILISGERGLSYYAQSIFSSPPIELDGYLIKRNKSIQKYEEERKIKTSKIKL